MRWMRSMIPSSAGPGSAAVGRASWEMNLPLASASATVVCEGRMSTPMMARSSFSRRKVGRRPRGRRPVGPSRTQFSSISCSTISEIVLRCRPETRARSAREIGCRVRIRLRTIRRLISRTTSLEAPCVRLVSGIGPVITILPDQSTSFAGPPMLQRSRNDAGGGRVEPGRLFSAHGDLEDSGLHDSLAVASDTWENCRGARTNCTVRFSPGPSAHALESFERVERRGARRTGTLYVELNHLLAGPFSGVPDLHRDPHVVAGFGGAGQSQVAIREGGVAQAVAEREERLAREDSGRCGPSCCNRRTAEAGRRIGRR